MTDKPDLDPFGIARTWMGQWEKFVNEHGTEWLAKPEAAQAMQAMSSAAIQAKAVSDEASGKVLAAANLPSRADVEALGTRIAGIEASLARIEAMLRTQMPDAAVPSRPAVRRTRKPPA